MCIRDRGCTVHLELKSTMDNDPDFVPRVLEVLQQTEMVEQEMCIRDRCIHSPAFFSFAPF